MQVESQVFYKLKYRKENSLIFFFTTGRQPPTLHLGVKENQFIISYLEHDIPGQLTEGHPYLITISLTYLYF